ncbi:unnamed protein product [Rhodiola kirilowii]
MRRYSRKTPASQNVHRPPLPSERRNLTHPGRLRESRVSTSTLHRTTTIQGAEPSPEVSSRRRSQ